MYDRWEKPLNKRPRQYFLYWLLFLFPFFTAIVLVYLYLPQLSFHFFSDTFLRLEEHAQKLEDYILSGTEQPQKIVDELKRARLFVGLSKNNHPLDPLGYYYSALFDFYELYFRLPLNQDSLIELCGRGFLPRQTRYIDIAPVSISHLARNALLSARKALALDADFTYANQTHLIISGASLLYTERTDLRELQRIQELQQAKLSLVFSRFRDWLSIAFYIQLGKKNLLFKLMDEIKQQKQKAKAASIALVQDNLAKAGPKQTFSRLYLRPYMHALLLCYGSYRAKSYVQALKFANLVKSMPGSPENVRTEGLRMKAEIFYIQRGARVARPYFEKAYFNSDSKDHFLKERMIELYQN